MGTCPRCGAQARPDDRFCTDCGASLPPLPSFDDIEPQDPGRPPEDPYLAGDPYGAGDPVRFSGPPVPALDEDGDPQAPIVQPTMDSWSQPPPSDWYSGAEVPRYPRGDTDPYGVPGWQADYPYQPDHDPVRYPITYARPPDNGRRDRRGRGILYTCIGVLAVLLIVAVGALALDTGEDSTAGPKNTGSPAATKSESEDSGTPSPSADTPEAQAKAVDALLTRASSGKNLLTTAYEKALECKISPEKAEKKFEAAAENRRGIVRSARKLDTSMLDNGPRIKSLLISTYQTSAKADDAFAAWARHGANQGHSCLKKNAKRTKGNNLSIKAGDLKKKFVKAWNPVAVDYGYSKRTKDGL